MTTTTTVDLIALATHERTDLARFLAGLKEQEWNAPTLGTQWRVRDVVAHIISYDVLSPVHLVGRFLHGALTLVLMLDPCGLIRSRWERRLQSAARLNTGLLVRTEHVLVSPERLALPAAGVQVEHRAGPLEEVRIARKDPAVVSPGTQGVVC